ncbi:MAG: tyrosine recombinase XerD [Clostridiales Family XIII bacterium]|jgi:integrase/recombinase XerD|nr:tyrosine recombinase XerD [Clostridiales Family XIII bacterium]
MYGEKFRAYLSDAKKMAPNSVTAYVRDLNEFEAYMARRGVSDLKDASESDTAAWLMELKSDNRSAATISRKLASVRAFFKYMNTHGIMSTNPSVDIRTPKVARKEVEYLTIEEVEGVLTKPDTSLKGVRDRAILELLYATGMRVTELIEMNIDDVNLRMGFVTLRGTHSKSRIIPLGRPARAALEEYIYEDRSKLLRDRHDKEKALFLNYYGERITRQALWKIMKGYAAQAKIEKKITPQTFRNSFAVHMIQNGADLKTLQELLGHEDISATQIYLSVTKNKIKDVYDRTHPRA